MGRDERFGRAAGCGALERGIDASRAEGAMMGLGAGETASTVAMMGAAPSALSVAGARLRGRSTTAETATTTRVKVANQTLARRRVSAAPLGAGDGRTCFSESSSVWTWPRPSKVAVDSAL